MLWKLKHLQHSVLSLSSTCALLAIPPSPRGLYTSCRPRTKCPPQHGLLLGPLPPRSLLQLGRSWYFIVDVLKHCSLFPYSLRSSSSSPLVFLGPITGLTVYPACFPSHHSHQRLPQPPPYFSNLPFLPSVFATIDSRWSRGHFSQDHGYCLLTGLISICTALSVSQGYFKT